MFVIAVFLARTNIKTHIPWRGKPYHGIVYDIADDHGCHRVKTRTRWVLLQARKPYKQI